MEGYPMRILDYLSESSVLFLDSTNKQEILSVMANKAAELDATVNVKSFTKAILERETIMSTGIGLQVAIPHAKLQTIQDFFVVAAILQNDAEWDALDKKPVRLVFMIGGPADKQADYLKILSKITLVIKNPARRKELRQAKDANAVLAAFAEL